MRIVNFQTEPVFEFRYLNAGRGSGQFYEDRLPVHRARVDRLPEGVSALVATADLQGRERFQDSRDGSIRLLGEVLPARLVNEAFPALKVQEPARAIALLAGDFYTVPALDKRGGTGDVTNVWLAFAEYFSCVAGIPGNHDSFGETPSRRPRFPVQSALSRRRCCRDMWASHRGNWRNHWERNKAKSAQRRRLPRNG
jgi:3',5'-cyclic-AMP phosphodiesterase